MNCSFHMRTRMPDYRRIIDQSIMLPWYLKAKHLPTLVSSHQCGCGTQLSAAYS